MDGPNALQLATDPLDRWIRAKLKIFANLCALAASGDERIFVLFGAGHLKILRDMIQDSGRFALIDPLDYLA